MSQQGCFSSQPAGDQAQVLVLDGEFDRSNAAQFEQALHEALLAARPHVIVDLRGVSFLDSTMLSVLVRGIGHGVTAGCQHALVRPNPLVWRLFVLTGLSHSFSAFGQLDEALASYELPS
jgi:anti-sigma B factor antagonist